MKVPLSRLNCRIRADVKNALQDLAVQWYENEGGFVGLTRVINEAAMMLLRREGIVLDSEYPSRAQRGKPVKRAKAPARRKRSAEAMSA